MPDASVSRLPRPRLAAGPALGQAQCPREALPPSPASLLPHCSLPAWRALLPPGFPENLPQLPADTPPQSDLRLPGQFRTARNTAITAAGTGCPAPTLGKGIETCFPRHMASTAREIRRMLLSSGSHVTSTPHCTLRLSRSEEGAGDQQGWRQRTAGPPGGGAQALPAHPTGSGHLPKASPGGDLGTPARPPRSR